MRLPVFTLRQWKFRILTAVLAASLLVINLLAITSPAMAATPTFVQTKSTWSSSTKTLSTSLPTTANGNLIAVYVVWNNTNSVKLTDTRGNSYESAGAATRFGAGNNISSQVFYAKNIAGGATNVSATFSTTAGANLYVQEYAGLDKTNPLDKASAAKGNSKTAASGPVTTANAQDLLFGAGATLSGSMTQGNSFTARSTAFDNLIQDKNVTTTGSYNSSATISTTAQWVMHVVAFKAAPDQDTTPPSTPTGLVATPVSPGRVDLNWQPSTDDRGVTGYVLSRDGTAVATITGTTYTDTALNPNTPYTYTVAAKDAAGNVSPSSDSAQVMTPADTEAPSVPAGLTASANAGAQVRLNWSASTDNVGVTGYKISRDGTEIATTATTTFTDTNLTADTTYTYTVAAIDAAGNISESSLPVTVTTTSALVNRPAQAASVMYGDGGDTSRAATYARPGGLVAAGRTNYQDQVFKDISAAGGTTLIYLDPIIDNSWGRYHTMLINASECGPATSRWPGNPKANQWGYLNDFRPGSVLQQKLECVLEKMVAENPHMGGWFADDVGSRSWFPNFNWDSWSTANKQAYRDGAIDITKTFRKVADKYGLMFIVNGTWGAGSLASSGGGYPDMNRPGNALADGGFVEHHSASELPYWQSYACSPQWATASPVTRGTAFMWAVTTTNSERDAYANSGCFAFVNNQPSAIYDYAAPWGTSHPTGLPSKVGGAASF